ncbi:bifunctional 2',3'-cyclic-nucleotide 2'-phosphodiesterase/3'-nucleotidase [Ruegeria sp. HKCCD4332]|uniref:bifunctional 2',3'-cyclic-nucleotide 2'-phosphodiesterase/3'-nucleotidase n=1 Tax=Ruegeria sp. HKCCD4332 TaxID=2683021 RepID=UPI0035304EAF
MKQNPSTQVPSEKNRGHVRILATTDLHMNLTGFDYYTDTPDPTLGLTRTASLIRKARQEAGDALVLLVDNGDAIQGTPLGEWAAQSDVPHPVMQAFAALEYDAIGLGNHDFGFGLPVLDNIISQAPCPVLCSNLHRSGSLQAWQRFAILDRTVLLGGKDMPLRIGLISVLPPQTTRWEEHHLNGEVTAEEIISTACELSKRLRAEGCDLIVALAHSGLGQKEPVEGMENAIIPLAAIDGIDAIVAGHTHLTLPSRTDTNAQYLDHANGLVHQTPVVMAGSAGSYLGVIDLVVSPRPNAGFSIEECRVDLRPVCASGIAVEEDQDMVRLFADAHRQTRSAVAKPVARVSESMHSYFSFCAPDRGLALVAAAQAAALRPFLHGSALEELPLLSAVAPGKSAGRAGPRHFTDVPAGEICLRHVTDLYPFPNELRALQINGADVLDWLEMSASVLNQLSPDIEADLVNPERAGYNFDVIFGLSYQIDPSQPARFDNDGRLVDPDNRRIRNLTFGGQPVQPAQRFVLASNNYRASGGGHFPAASAAQRINLPPLDIKELTRDYLSRRLPPDPISRHPYPFTLTAQTGVNALLRTGPGALEHMDELRMFNAQMLSPDEAGFERIRLTF